MATKTFQETLSLHLNTEMAKLGYRPVAPNVKLTWTHYFPMVRADLTVVPVPAGFDQVGHTAGSQIRTHGVAYTRPGTRPAPISGEDITANYHKGNENSKEAAKKAKVHAARDFQRILAFVASRAMTGATCDEIEEALEMSHQTCSARCADLKKDSRLVPSGQKRKTRKGCNADVLILPHLLTEPF